LNKFNSYAENNKMLFVGFSIKIYIFLDLPTFLTYHAIEDSGVVMKKTFCKFERKKWAWNNPIKTVQACKFISTEEVV
jgi:hypothetical protein